MLPMHVVLHHWSSWLYLGSRSYESQSPLTSFPWSNYHRITWTLRGSDKSRHRYTSSLISFFIVGGWNGYFFLNYRGCVCSLGITTKNQGCCTYHSSATSKICQMIAAFNGRTRIIEVLWGQTPLKIWGQKHGWNLRYPWFLGLVFKTIVRWFSFIQLVSTFYGYVFYIKWSSKSGLS